MSSQEFKEYIVLDVLGEIPDIATRRMFGGWGIYWRGVIVGIIADNVLYLKADDELQRKYLTRDGYELFSYEKQGKVISISYISVPEEELESPEEILSRIEESYVVSLGK